MIGDGYKRTVFKQVWMAPGPELASYSTGTRSWLWGTEAYSILNTVNLSSAGEKFVCKNNVKTAVGWVLEKTKLRITNVVSLMCVQYK